MKIGRGLFPVAAIQDRYGGSCAGDAWLAIAMADHLQDGCYRSVRCLEQRPHSDDVEAQFFWREPPSWIVSGNTPDRAVATLKAALAAAEA